jgi:hypothetical protein
MCPIAAIKFSSRAQPPPDAHRNASEPSTPTMVRAAFALISIKVTSDLGSRCVFLEFWGITARAENFTINRRTN